MSEASSERYFERLTLNQRIQHIALIVSFMTLVVTGLPLRYPEAWASSVVIKLLGGFAVRSVMHRYAAAVLIGLTCYHVAYSLLTRRGRSELVALIPNFKDGFDALHMILFYLGFKSDTPKFSRYNYVEKFEYLAVGWGSVVMIGTGFVLWFQSQAMQFLPKWALDIAKVIHSYEALLAFLAIIIWHFYHVHWNPEVFPMSRIWLDGKISEHDMLEHHPLEYASMVKQQLSSAKPYGEAEGTADVPGAGSPPPDPGGDSEISTQADSDTTRKSPRERNSRC